MSYYFMKFFTILLFSLLITSNSNAAAGVGKGSITLSNGTVNHFYDYVKGGYGKKPGSFFVTVDGNGSSSWTCPEGQCQSVNVQEGNLACERYWQTECKLFAKSRTIKWKNGINPGKGKVSRMNSKWSNSEFKNKLRELGFIN